MSFWKLIPIAIMLPPVAIGAFAMYRSQVSIAIWSQNVACLVFMSFVSLIMGNHKFNIEVSKYKKLVLPSALVLLILTFASHGMDGVHRWISIAVVRLNMAMIILPILLIELWSVLKTKGFNLGLVISFVIVMVLFFQPDASQLTGFAVPAMIMLSRNTKSKVMGLFIAFAFSLFIVFSWIHLDNLSPVNYVEGILKMVANMGFIWLVLGVISLVILPLPFILFPPKNAECISKYIGSYYIIIILATLFGNFPVPLMGYGISPIIGYYISLMWYLNSKYVKNKV